MMTAKWLLAFALTSWFSVMPLAQAQKMEIAGDYSLVVYNPAKNFVGSRNLNGGGGSFTYNFSKFVGFKADFQGYGTENLTFSVVATPPYIPRTASFTTQANLFSYLFGPQFNIPLHRVRIFGETLFGAAHTNGYANLFNAAGVTGLSASNNGFAMAFGGGLDIPVREHVAIRPGQFDYFLTRYEWAPIGINNQSNFRYVAGVVFVFGGS
jgi:Outer membrane protein beta-barrel domain